MVVKAFLRASVCIHCSEGIQIRMRKTLSMVPCGNGVNGWMVLPTSKKRVAVQYYSKHSARLE